MSRYLITEPAKDDIRELLDYINQRSPSSTVRVRRKLREAMQRLARFPGIDHLREDLTDQPLRFWCVYSYLIIYRAERKPIEIIRVLHGAQDVRAILERG